MSLPLKDFKNKNADFLLDQCFETTKIYFGHNLTHSELNSEVYKNGKVAFLNLKLYLNDATTMEQDILNSFIIILTKLAIKQFSFSSDTS